MTAFPPKLFIPICLSIFTSTLLLILGALVLPVTPVLWIIPGAFISTIAYHALVILFANSDTTRSTRGHSLPSVAGAYVLTVVWTAVLAITLTFTLLLCLGKSVPKQGQPRINPILITACATSLFQPIIMGTIAVISHKEWKRSQYRAKWQWNPAINTSKWSIAQESS